MLLKATPTNYTTELKTGALQHQHRGEQIWFWLSHTPIKAGQPCSANEEIHCLIHRTVRSEYPTMTSLNTSMCARSAKSSCVANLRQFLSKKPPQKYMNTYFWLPWRPKFWVLVDTGHPLSMLSLRQANVTRAKQLLPAPNHY